MEDELAKSTRRPLTRKQKRKIALLVILALLLALLAAYYFYYRSTQRLGLDISPIDEDFVEPPQYLYSFNGGENRRMQRPTGVLIDGNEALVVDAAKHEVGVYTLEGEFKRSFGASDTIVPLYIAKHPKTGDYYMSDRRARAVKIFAENGKYKGEFDPKLPKEQLPDFDTRGVQWAPLALAFGEDGTLYVTEILNGHRLLIFGPDGKFKRSVGDLGIVVESDKAPEVFQFPNGVAVFGRSVYVADSNNRRVQVFKLDGTYERIIDTKGLPRGVAFLGPFPSDDASTSPRFVVVDTLAHDGTLWNIKGDKLVSFGQQGVLEGEFNYPNGVAVGPKNRIFIADTANGRVQVWGWPGQVSPVPVPRLPRTWWPCLIPFLLLPLLLLLRKKEFFATRDFVLAMVEAQEADLMPHRRRRWVVTNEDYEELKSITQGDVEFDKLLHPSEYSESDVRALMEKLEVPQEQAILLSLAQRAKVFTTEDAELRRLAKVLEIDVVNRVEFVERFTNKATTQVDNE